MGLSAALKAALVQSRRRAEGALRTAHPAARSRRAAAARAAGFASERESATGPRPVSRTESGVGRMAAK